MGKGSREDASKASESPRRTPPKRLLTAAWLVPGLGHYLLGKRKRAAIFGSIILCSFITGVLLNGELGVLRHNSPFSWLATLACLGNGVLYLGRLLWLNKLDAFFSSGFPFDLLGGGDQTAQSFNYGNTFLYTAGLMNLLAVLDVSDIARGDKD